MAHKRPPDGATIVAHGKCALGCGERIPIFIDPETGQKISITSGCPNLPKPKVRKR